jgi:hypothetical protein
MQLASEALQAGLHHGFVQLGGFQLGGFQLGRGGQDGAIPLL